MAQTAVDNEKYFGDLDAVVGDGDFGYSLARGFEIVLADWDDIDRTDAATFLQEGRGDDHQPDRRHLGPDLGHRLPARRPPRSATRPNRRRRRSWPVLRAAIEGIKPRGKSDVGDKTLLDALVPATDALEEALGRRRRGRRGRVRGHGAAAGGRGDQEHARQAGPRQLHRRAQHRHRSTPAPSPSRCMVEQIAAGWPDLGWTAGYVQSTEECDVKKFVNDPKDFVPEMLTGIALANPDTLKYVPEYNLIMRADAPSDDKVSIIQGSGSGHEPAHVMIVGKGMLDAACPGDVFAAPPMDYVLETSKLLNSPKGVLHIINNYTGDRMAFDMGREMAEAEGVTDRDGHRRRRRRGEGLDLHRRPARRGRQLLRHQGGRRGRGAGRRARRPRRARRAGQLRDPDHGHGAHLLHAAGQGLAAVRARRRRDGDGRRHPRRAGPPAGEAGLAPTRSSTSCSRRSSPTCRSSRATTSR